MTRRNDELCALSLSAVSHLIAARTVSSLEVTEAVLERAERLNPVLNAFVTITADLARDAARRADAEIGGGRYRGPLHGVPYTLKDLILTAGIRTTASARILADWVPEKSGTVYRRLEEAGAVLIGKTNMLEFAYGEVHPDFGPALNPWNTAFGTSGSSSGSGAAVAAGLGYASIGSDTGGSIRFPAAVNGIVGLKPTYGLVSRAGGIALSWTLDHFGPMTRTARDAALLLDVIAGHDPADPASAPDRARGFTTRVDAPPDRLRIGVVAEHPEDNLMPEVRRAYDDAAETLRALGHELREVVLPDPGIATRALIAILYPEATTLHLPWLRTRADDYAPNTRQRLEMGAFLPGSVYLRGRRAASVVVEHYRRLFDDVDVLLTPLATYDGYLVAEPPAPPITDGGDRLAPLMRFSGPFNVTGLPAVSVPCRLSSRGLPIAVQFAGRPFDDGLLLQVAHHFEQAVRNRLPRPDNGMVV